MELLEIDGSYGSGGRRRVPPGAEPRPRASGRYGRPVESRIRLLYELLPPRPEVDWGEMPRGSLEARLFPKGRRGGQGFGRALRGGRTPQTRGEGVKPSGFRRRREQVRETPRSGRREAVACRQVVPSGSRDRGRERLRLPGPRRLSRLLRTDLDDPRGLPPGFRLDRGPWEER